MLSRFRLALLLTAALPVGAAVIEEDFDTDPFARGWRVHGDSSLFRWNAAHQNIDATWDSSRTNSFLHLPLGTILGHTDNFSLSFEVRLSDIRLGNTPGKTNEFQIALGLIHYASAIRTNHYAGAGVSTAYGIRNVVEFDYFPDAGFGETFTSVVVSTNNRIYPVHNFPLKMTTGDTFQITLSYTATDQTLRTTATKNGAPFGPSSGNAFAELSLVGRNDFRVDSFAITSYSDAIQAGPPKFHGSILAHGTFDNVRLGLPPPAVAQVDLSLANTTWQATFNTATHWLYTLERSDSLSQWIAVSETVTGTGTRLTLVDSRPAPDHAFYRVRAERP